MEATVERSVYILCASLIREYLSKKGLYETLRCMDSELPNGQENLNSHLLAKELNIEYILQKNKNRSNPYRTMLEVIIFELTMNNKYVEKQNLFRIHFVDNKPRLREIQKNLVSLKRPIVNITNAKGTIKELNLTQPKQIGVQISGAIQVSKLFEIKYRPFRKQIHDDGLADLDAFLTSLSDKDRSRAYMRNSTEDSLKEYEETVKEAMEFNRTNPRVYSQKFNETPLKIKEGILLGSINTAIDPSTYNNKNRLGPNKENTFQCLKRSRSTSSMSNIASISSPSLLELQINKDSDNPLRSKSRSINLPHQLDVSLDKESISDEFTKEDETTANDLLVSENSSLIIVNDQEKEDITENKEMQLDEVSAIETDKTTEKKEVLCAEGINLETNGSVQYINNHSTRKTDANFGKEEDVSIDRTVHSISHKRNNSFTDSGLSNTIPLNKSKKNSQIISDVERSDDFKYLTLETVLMLKKTLIKSALNTFSYQWMGQSFILNMNPKLQYGFVQNKGGACGVLATVQGFLLKALLFNPSTTTTNIEPFRPSAQEVRSALIQSFCDILWQAGQSQQAVLVCLCDKSHLEASNIYNTDGLTEFLCYKRFTSLKDLQNAIDTYLTTFTSKEGKGCLLFIISVILSRGIDCMLEDMDDNTCDLIASNGTCALELVTLLLTGRAVSNVFDNNIHLDSCLLKGITKRSDIGFLSLYEHYNSCQVGSNLKTPRYPIWLVNNGNHFSIIFSTHKQLVSDWRAEKKFQLHHYDGMIRCNDEIILQIDTTGMELGSSTEDHNVSTLDLCVRTKWKDADVKWTTNINK